MQEIETITISMAIGNQYRQFPTYNEQVNYLAIL